MNPEKFIKSLSQMALLDGEIDLKEKKIIFEVNKEFNLSLPVILEFFNDPDLKRANLYIPGKPEERKKLLKYMVKIAWCNGEASPMQVKIIKAVAGKSGVIEEEWRSWIEKPNVSKVSAHSLKLSDAPVAEPKSGDDTKYNVVFIGSFYPGYDQELVLQKLAAVYKKPQKAFSGWFTGEPVTLKKKVSMSEAVKIEDFFRKQGMLVTILEEGIPIENAVRNLRYDTHQVDTTSQRKETEKSGEIICPKCGKRQPQTDICSGCGIVIENYDLILQRKKKSEANSGKSNTQSVPLKREYSLEEGTAIGRLGTISKILFFSAGLNLFFSLGAGLPLFIEACIQLLMGYSLIKYYSRSTSIALSLYVLLIVSVDVFQLFAGDLIFDRFSMSIRYVQDIFLVYAAATAVYSTFLIRNRYNIEPEGSKSIHYGLSAAMGLLSIPLLFFVGSTFLGVWALNFAESKGIDNRIEVIYAIQNNIDDPLLKNKYEARLKLESDPYHYARALEEVNVLGDKPENFMQQILSISYEKCVTAKEGVDSLALKKIISVCDSLLSNNKYDAFANNEKAVALTLWGKYDLALDEVHRALILLPHEPEFYEQRSIILKLLGKNTEALSDKMAARKYWLKKVAMWEAQQKKNEL